MMYFDLGTLLRNGAVLVTWDGSRLGITLDLSDFSVVTYSAPDSPEVVEVVHPVDEQLQDSQVDNIFNSLVSLKDGYILVKKKKNSPLSKTVLPSFDELADARLSSSKQLDRSEGGNGSLENEAVQQVFSYWKQVSGHDKSKLTATRRKKIKERLKSYTVDELKRAVDGCQANPFYLGQNDRTTQYNFPETIFKNDESVERHIRYLEASAGSDRKSVVVTTDEERVLKAGRRL